MIRHVFTFLNNVSFAKEIKICYINGEIEKSPFYVFFIVYLVCS